MAFVKQYIYGPAIVNVHDDYYKGVTREQGAKILEDALNDTSLAKNRHFKVSVKKHDKDDTG
ncbi:MAG: hypothetical protein HFI75_00710 [Lachnospiraceae bacterium]|nr:hypothetical protein [Lachnospiraceae bacterium]